MHAGFLDFKLHLGIRFCLLTNLAVWVTIYCQFVMIHVECDDGDIRIGGSLNPLEGRVEVCHSGLWGTVCRNGWDDLDASVACKQLGFSSYGTYMDEPEWYYVFGYV